MKIYTKTGDKGETQLIGKRVRKSHERVEAYGTLDELNSYIGVTITFLDENCSDIKEDLQKIQHELFDLGGDLANVTKKENWATKDSYVAYLENRIDIYWKEAPQLTSFILPGGVQGAAYLHVCRTIARRAERNIVDIEDDTSFIPLAIRYVNRLSDFLFAAARVVNARSNVIDMPYEQKRE
ncbi:cob(I)yrinic acid a,c-diamide adenosyltransferase [Evansella sp. AB-rgal1]|uniref:cob(I)yrinic acid a,c-diamide adenosyltransferase n=1 Tax=Evansella sp. AB-rgal1 TaxID=3242696 RepID=UPI00359CF886